MQKEYKTLREYSEQFRDAETYLNSIQILEKLNQSLHIIVQRFENIEEVGAENSITFLTTAMWNITEGLQQNEQVWRAWIGQKLQTLSELYSKCFIKITKITTIP